MEKRLNNLAGPSVFRSVTYPKASILIISLWVLFMLAAFAVILGYSVRQKLSLAIRLVQRDEARHNSWANIKLAINEVKAKQKEGSLSFLGDHLAGNKQAGEENKEESAGFVENEYGIFVEEAKININQADLSLLKRFFRILLGCAEIEAGEFAAAIVDWRDKDSMLSLPLGSAEDSYYTGLPYPYECKDADFSCLSELLLVKGITPEVFARVRDYLTIYGSGLVNINAAPKEVLLALGLNEYLVNNIVSFRCGKDKKCGTKDDNYFTSTSDIPVQLGNFCPLNEAQAQMLEAVAARYLTVESNYFMVKSAVWFKGQEAYQSSCALDYRGKILYWEEF